MREAALEAGYEDDDTRGTTNGVSNWLRGLIAERIGESETMNYHQWKELFAKCVHGELENFREIFTRYVDPEKSPLHKATYDLGSLLQDIPKGPVWGDDIGPLDHKLISHQGGLRVKEPIHEILLRAVMHSVNYLSFGDVRLGGGSPPREKASNLYPVLVSHLSNRGEEGRGFTWVERALNAGQALCRALETDGSDRDIQARHCSDLIGRARQFL